MKPFREYRKLSDGRRVAYARWRGRVIENGKRRKVVLFTDKKVSERELAKLQAEADANSQDGQASLRRRHAARHIDEHVRDYVQFIERTTKSKAHHRITDCMLKKLVKLGGWQRLSDITQESMEGVLKALASAGRPATVAYQNCFIKRAKAFVHWCMPERLSHDPLVKVRRGSVTRALKRRARRAVTLDEIAGLLRVSPAEYQFKWAFLLLSGFRRSEFAALTWGDLRLNAPIPFIHLRAEWTKNEKADALPLHPLLVKMLGTMSAGMPTTRVVSSVPDVATSQKYFKLGGGEVTVNGLNFDLHALRHTFKSWLDEAGCSEATKRALLRHSVPDVSGGYSHPRLAELYAAVCRLPVAVDEEEQALKTGTDDAPIGGTQLGQKLCVAVQSDARACTVALVGSEMRNSENHSEKQGDCTQVRACARSNLRIDGSGDIVRKLRPGTQAD